MGAGEIVQSMTASAVPPSESLSRCVSFELRYGTCASRVSLDARVEMTSPSVVSDWLMAMLSCRRSEVEGRTAARGVASDTALRACATADPRGRVERQLQRAPVAAALAALAVARARHLPPEQRLHRRLGLARRSPHGLQRKLQLRQRYAQARRHSG